MDKSGLKRSFKDTYYGNAVDGLYKHLEKCDEKHGPMHFARVISVIQSSGTGKSRTVLELSKRGVIILYINVRGPLDLNSFPNRDDIPADMLTSQLDDSEHDYNRRCLAFLMAVYATLRDFLDSYKRVAGTGGIAQRWNDSMCNLDSPDRDMFFSRMKRKYNLALKRLRDENAPKPNSGSQPEQLSSGVKALQVAYEALLNDFPTVFDRSSNHPKLVIAIDDAHTLNEVKGCKYRPMDVLCSTISTCLSVECSNWTLFVSTASHIADLVPTRGMRHQIGGDTHAPLLFPPYTLLGWDQMARPLSEISPLEVAQFSNIARFGRPL
ncbi:hypothetical protein BDV93DRAFT_362289 [Ceratobasidium sp. AG-I]|nr:hypothetical protein BDV93DRAFT_362289 [Ceratobasidium sp. AG-I]